MIIAGSIDFPDVDRDELLTALVDLTSAPVGAP